MFYKEEKFEEYIFVKPADSKQACRETSGTCVLRQKERTNDSIPLEEKCKWLIYKHLRLHRDRK